MAVKSADAKELYGEYFERVRVAIEHAIDNGDSAAAISQRIGAHRSAVHAIRMGTYSSILNSELLIAFDLEFNLGIFKK